MKKKSITDLLIFIVSAELVGAVSALFTGGYIGTYSAVVRPPLSPPSWVFPVVWALLYAAMGVSAYMVYRHEGELRNIALGSYILQLAVNFSWSIIFFRFGLFTAGTVVALILTVLVLVMIYLFSRIEKTAGIINLPYLAWLIFASYLAIGTAILN